MYDTTLGIRVLSGAEARLFASAAWSLTDQLRSFIPDSGDQQYDHLIGISVLDSLTAAQVIVLVDRVTAYLLDPKVAAPTRTALLDATIAAVFQQVVSNLESEIDLECDSTEAEDGDTSMRIEIAAASEQMSIQESDPRGSALNTPDPECAVMETWQFVIDGLCDRVLPDTDWQLESVALDMDPNQGAELKGNMGIDDDYFIEVVGDATVEDAASAWCDMIERISGWRPEKWRFGGGFAIPADAELPPTHSVLSFSENEAEQPSSQETKPDFQQTKLVLLSDVTSELEIDSEEWSSFVNRKTGEVVGLPTDAITFIEAGEDAGDYFGNGKESLELAREICESDDYIGLPSQLEINEWSIMRDFSDRVDSASDREELLAAIHGSGAFRFFRATIARLDLQDQWHSYRNAAIEGIVIHWLEANTIKWSRAQPDEPPF